MTSNYADTTCSLNDSKYPVNRHYTVYWRHIVLHCYFTFSCLHIAQPATADVPSHSRHLTQLIQEILSAKLHTSYHFILPHNHFLVLHDGLTSQLNVTQRVPVVIHRIPQPTPLTCAAEVLVTCGRETIAAFFFWKFSITAAMSPFSALSTGNSDIYNKQNNTLLKYCKPEFI
jgi:hypothetical protein